MRFLLFKCCIIVCLCIILFRGGKYSGPWDHWSQKIFYAGRKKKGKEEKGGKKEKGKKEMRGKKQKKERKRIERKRNITNK